MVCMDGSEVVISVIRGAQLTVCSQSSSVFGIKRLLDRYRNEGKKIFVMHDVFKHFSG